MKSKHKLFAFFITVIFFASIFTACGKPDELLPGKYELNIYTQEEDGRIIRDQKIAEIYENTGVDTLIHVEPEQKDAETLGFRYSEAGDNNEAEYAELIKQKDCTDESAEYPQDVNCIAGEKIQVSQAALQGMQEILPMEDTLQKTNALSEGLAAHTGLGYPWLILGVPVWEHDMVVSVGTVEIKEDILPGAAEGVWSIVTIGGVEYYYGCYDCAPDEWDLFSYVITGEQLVLENGLHAGITEEEMLHVCPGLVKIEFTDDRSPWQFNGGGYAADFVDSYDYFYAAQILCGCEESENEHVPLELALLIKDGKVTGITVFSPTAG